jgi:hypothetical protein
LGNATIAIAQFLCSRHPAGFFGGVAEKRRIGLEKRVTASSASRSVLAFASCPMLLASLRPPVPQEETVLLSEEIGKESRHGSRCYHSPYHIFHS